MNLITDRSIGLQLRLARQYRGYSQQVLANKLGVHQNLISAYELGRKKMSDNAKIKSMEQLGFPLNFLNKIVQNPKVVSKHYK